MENNLGELNGKFCIKIFGIEKNGVTIYSSFVVLPYKSDKKKKFETDMWKKQDNEKVTLYIKAETSYNICKKIAQDRLKTIETKVL